LTQFCLDVKQVYVLHFEQRTRFEPLHPDCLQCARWLHHSGQWSLLSVRRWSCGWGTHFRCFVGGRVGRFKSGWY